MTSLADLTTPHQLNFCPGCGDISIWAAFRQAAVEQGWDASNTALTAGVGCHGHMLNFVKITGFGSLHGRAVPVATGIKLANNRLNVFTYTGDGDSLAEGTNHYIHAARRNHDITLILHDNAVYGLTTGQTSPRSPNKYKSKSTPTGNIDNTLNPLTTVIAAGATFVGRVYAGDIPKVKEMLIAANNHKGFALVDILQPCYTFNKEYTHEFYRENIYWLPDDYDPTDKNAAFAKAQEWDLKKIPVGIFYQEKRPSYEQQIPHTVDAPLVSKEPVVKDISSLLNKYK